MYTIQYIYFNLDIMYLYRDIEEIDGYLYYLPLTLSVFFFFTLVQLSNNKKTTTNFVTIK